ncbi:hypothetical protein ACTOB_004697 [Actinoplanes oblitus]|uniref:Uncharacterized protein n=1 Tax=Actinoplanes oblitus TaxID=3040509 RepID=A0ABY8W6U7_9ACTN|nr:hypothetical protein [Actinoplanes oblitus]WIM92742.1 hypothetical protein ACTOB_004697 [Actinoplanes oblitus]
MTPSPRAGRRAGRYGSADRCRLLASVLALLLQRHVSGVQDGTATAVVPPGSVRPSA